MQIIFGQTASGYGHILFAKPLEYGAAGTFDSDYLGILHGSLNTLTTWVEKP